MSQMMQMYQQVGLVQFSVMIGQFVFYFVSIVLQFVELCFGYVEVIFFKCCEVLNYIGMVYVIVLCNVVELVVGIMIDVLIFVGYCWILCGMIVEYLVKVIGDVCVVVDGSQIDW